MARNGAFVPGADRAELTWAEQQLEVTGCTLVRSRIAIVSATLDQLDHVVLRGPFERRTISRMA
jgi:hypothetical protein